MLNVLGCDDEANELARVTDVLKTCSPSCKSEFEAEMSDCSDQSTFAQIKLDTREFSTCCDKEIATAVKQEKFQWAQSVKGVRERITLTSQAKLEQMDAHGSMDSCIAETEQIFGNMLKDFGSLTCQFAYPVLRAF